VEVAAAGAPTVARRSALLPLVLATMASQGLLVVLSPTIVAIGDDLGASVSAVGQARSITAVVAVVSSLFITSRIGAIGVRRLLVVGSALAVVACALVASAPGLWAFLAAHVVVGVAFACLLSGGFAGSRRVSGGRPRAWAAGYVVGANSLAWIVVNPVVRALTERLSWRVAELVPATIALAALLTARSVATVRGAGAAPRLRGVLADVSARRWIGSELVAYAAWTGLLTFVGAFFIDTFGVTSATAGWLLAAGAAAHFTAATRSGRLVARFSRRRLVVVAGLAMTVLLPLLLANSRSLAAAARLLRRRRRGRDPHARVEQPRPRAAAGSSGDDDGHAHGRHPARSSRRRCTGRRGDRLCRLPGAQRRPRGRQLVSALLVLRVRDPAMSRDLVPSHGRTRRVG
jgi:predicted MFS family arabinose efflux permease